MQVTQYTDDIPVDQLKVGDILIQEASWTPLTYISSIKKCPSVRGGSYLRFNIKRLGASCKDKVLDYFNSSAIHSYNEHSVVFERRNVTVVRLNSPEELAKFGVSWKYAVQCFDNAVTLYSLCAAMYRTLDYYGVAYMLELLGKDSKLQEILEDRITDAIRDNVKTDLLIEELSLESVEQYGEFIAFHTREVALLILNGESVLDIRNRVAAWKLAYADKEEATMRMQQAFTIDK